MVIDEDKRDTLINNIIIIKKSENNEVIYSKEVPTGYIRDRTFSNMITGKMFDRYIDNCT